MNCRRFISLLLAVFMLAGAMPAFAAADADRPVQSIVEQPVARTLGAGERIRYIAGSADGKGKGIVAELEEDPELVSPAAAPDQGSTGELPGETAELNGLIDTENMWFYGINLSGAGAAQMDNWASGEYGSIFDREGGEMDYESLKGRLMLRCMHFNAWYYDSPIAYFFPTTGEPSIHELSLYGDEDLDVEDISVTGVTLLTPLVKHVYGDEGGELYWYTAKIQVPTEDSLLEIAVDGKDFANLPLTHVEGSAPKALFSTFAIYDYTENDEEPERVESVTMQISGFSLPENASSYNLVWHIYEEDEEGNGTERVYYTPGSELTEPNEVGYRYLTFDVRTGYRVDTEENTVSKESFPHGVRGHEELMWSDMTIGWVDPEAPKITDSQGNLDIGDYTAYFFGGDEHLVKDSGGVWSFPAVYENFSGVNVIMPVPYYSLYKELPPGPEVRPTYDFEDYVEYYDAAVMDGTDVTVTLHPGSYEDGLVKASVYGHTVVDWTSAKEGKSLTFPLCNWNGQPATEYGSYGIRIAFKSDELRLYGVSGSVVYTDGVPGVLSNCTVVDVDSWQEPDKDEGGAYILKGSEDKYYRFVAYPPTAYSSLDSLYPEKQIVVCEFYDSEEIVTTKQMTFDEDNRYYYLIVKRSEILEAEGVRIYNNGEAPCLKTAGEAVDLKLANEEPFILRALQVPMLDSELREDETGKYRAVKLGSVLTAVFEASSKAPWSHLTEFEYVDTNGYTRIVHPTEEPVGKRGFRVSVPIPDDADTLTALRCTIFNSESTDYYEPLVFDLSDHRISAESFLSGIPAEYEGVKVELKDAGGRIRKYFVDAENYVSISLGDLPSGDYQYEITGASGHIAGGNVTVARGEDIAFDGLPALGSLIVTTTGFKSSINGKEINPASAVDVEMTTPDGTVCKLMGVTGEAFRQIPVGTTGTVEVEIGSEYDEISACTAEDDSFTVAGDETLAFTFKPFTFRTISGSVWGVKTYSNGAQYGMVPNPTRIILTQEITRGGKKETVTFTATPAYGYESRPRGKWSAMCYDNIPVKVEFRSFTWDTKTVTVTDPGDVNIGQTTMTYGNEMLIEIRAQTTLPGSVKADGSPYYGTADSVTTPVDSGFLNVSQVWIYSKGVYYASGGEFETVVRNGKTYLKLHEGLVVAGESIAVCAGGSIDYGGWSLSVLPRAGNGSTNYSYVRTDEDGNPYVLFDAVVNGGRFRATVVDDRESEYVGFLAYPTGTNTCTFAYGRGELTVPYGKYQAGGSGNIVAFMVPEKDAEDMAELLRSSPKLLWEKQPTNGGWSTYFFEQEYGGRLIYKTVSAANNSIIYLEDMQPTKPLLTGVLPPYSFSYRYELTNNASTIRLVATLSKRYPDQMDQDKITSLDIYTIDDRNGHGELNATVTAKQTDIGNGQTLITAELPLTYDLRARFRVSLKYWHRSVTEDAGYHTMDFEHSEPVKIFSLANPGDVYIADQLDAQGLTGATPEAQATWYLNLSLRSFISDKPEENQITVYDNGTLIYSFDVGEGRRNSWGTAGWTDKLRVRLTDNLEPGIHVVWANRIIDGETISTEPAVFTLSLGRQNNSVYVSQLYWYHWNHRLNWDENHPDEFYFENLSDLAGENIWIWPSKRHFMQFTVKNATSDDLKGVNLVFQAYWAQSNGNFNSREPEKYGYHRSSTASDISGYNTVTRAVPCKFLRDNKLGNYSVWGIDEFYMGYLQSFEFEFEYMPAIEDELKNMTEEELASLEAEAFYTANGLGEVPDGLEQIETINSMTAAERNAVIADMSEASQAMSDLDLKITEDNANRMKMQLQKPTAELSEYTVTMEKSGTMQLPDILMLMEKERENGNQNPKEKGWDVTWAEFDTAQGKTLLRIASYDGVEASTGRHALLTHTTYYVTKSVADALENGTGTKTAADTEHLTLMGEDKPTPDHWTKQLYDGTSAVYSVSDLTDEAWKAYCKSRHLKLHPGDLEGATKFANSESLIPKKLDGTMKVLGVVDTVITYAKGPSGADPNGLRELLKNVRDERAYRSLEQQIKDYENLRYDIYKQDCAMSTYSTASNFSPMGPIGKVVVFVGGLANGIISGYAKDYNRDVYNTTLHDIQLQIKYEAVKQERLKKSFMDAEKWLRDKMDSIYGKGNWSEYALAEERKLWVLKEYPGGILRYVWKDKAPEFSVTQDPSGFVYEAVTEDIVQGVKASLYYSATEDGSYSLWTDPFGEQTNPQLTSDTGNYMWMVPIGWWKVRYEKEGYKTSESIAMPVPPIHTTVNIGLLSEEAPKAAVSAENGGITVLFSKYMQLESLIRLYGGESYTDGSEAGTVRTSYDSSAFAVQFYDAEGNSVPGTVTFPDIRENTGYKGNDYGTDVIGSDWFVRYAVFTPEDPNTDVGSLTWQFAEGMVSYAGVALDGETAALHVIRLEADGGWLARDTLVTDGNSRLSQLPEPSRENSTFLGWFTAAEGGDEMTAEDVFSTDMTLYARWRTDYLVINENTDTAASHTIKCTVSPQSRNITIIAAAYSARGQMLAVTTDSVSKDVAAKELTITLDAGAEDSYVKVFVLDADTREPLDIAQYYRLPN